MEIIRANHITKTYSNGLTSVEVIRDISLEIQEGEFVSIIGPSGSGKSTILYLLSGLEDVSSGEVLYRGQNLASMPEKEMAKLRREKIGFVYQFYNLISEMNVRDNVLLPSLAKKEKIDEKKLKEALDTVDLLDKQWSYPQELSGGQQQRVAIARVLYADPEIIFADEPTGSLDSKNGKIVMDLFQKINRERKTSILMVTHSLEQAHLAQRQIKVLDGKI